MKPALPKTILYDDSCPMCRAYTRGFVKWGVLEAENRIPFSRLDPAQAGRYMDLARSRHEIPLVDLASGQTLYGVDALVCLLGHRLPVVARLMQIACLRRLAGRLYAFVSYNRRVITATAPAAGGMDCAPDFHAAYRLALVGLAAAAGGGVAWALGRAASVHVPALTGLWMLLAFGGLCVLAAVWCGPGRRGLEKAGQAAVLVLLGALCILPGLGLHAATGAASPVWLAGGLLLAGGVAGAEGRRRLRYLHAQEEGGAAPCDKP